MHRARKKETVVSGKKKSLIFDAEVNYSMSYCCAIVNGTKKTALVL